MAFLVYDFITIPFRIGFAISLIGEAIILASGIYMLYSLGNLISYHVEILTSGLLTKEDLASNLIENHPYHHKSFRKNFAACFEGMRTPSILHQIISSYKLAIQNKDEIDALVKAGLNPRVFPDSISDIRTAGQAFEYLISMSKSQIVNPPSDIKQEFAQGENDEKRSLRKSSKKRKRMKKIQRITPMKREARDSFVMQPW